MASKSLIIRSIYTCLVEGEVCKGEVRKEDFGIEWLPKRVIIFLSLVLKLIYLIVLFLNKLSFEVSGAGDRYLLYGLLIKESFLVRLIMKPIGVGAGTGIGIGVSLLIGEGEVATSVGD